jgi:hypothetical protein
MNIYKITVDATVIVEYEIEADSEEGARDLLGMGDQTPKDSSIIDWDIIEIEEYI